MITKKECIINMCKLLRQLKQDRLSKKFEEVVKEVLGVKNKNIGFNKEILPKEIKRKDDKFDLLCKTNTKGKPMYLVDKVVATIEIIDKVYIKYINNAIYDKNKDSLVQDKNKLYCIEDKSLPAIVLILESPHREEFKYNHIAIGHTGSNISDYFLSNLANILTYSTNKESIYYRNKCLIDNNTYRLIIANPIQYQCSLGIEKSPYKKEIFEKCWNCDEFRDDFISRIKSYKPSLIINCCTGQVNHELSGLQGLVQKEINKHFYAIPKMYGYHPSSDHFTKGFKLI